jgi:16S rRNA (cytosine1402-N4)-methyltransferase
MRTVPPVHRPVMVEEVLRFLEAGRGGMFVDATFGGGGHTRTILGAHPLNRVLAIDRDAEALESGRSSLGSDLSRVELLHADYRDLGRILRERAGVEPAGILVDMGLSSRQLLDPERGFSFREEGPLDMRMDRASGRTAADLVNTLPERELRRLIREYGEDHHAARISRAIVRRRVLRPFALTTELTACIAGAVPRRGPERIHPATRTFQALRIAVNDELAGLGRFIEESVEALPAGGRFVAIAFHSLEDRPVKTTLRSLAHRCVCPTDLPLCACGRTDLVRILTPRAVRPSADEVARNPASRSARLRAAERLAA